MKKVKKETLEEIIIKYQKEEIERRIIRISLSDVIRIVRGKK